MLAQLLAFIDASACSESVLAALSKETDNKTKAYLQIAVGWSGDAKAAEAVIKGLKDGSRVMSRASFIAAERTKNAAVVERLFELLKDGDLETRWNAAYTLGVISERKASINIFLPEAEAKVQIAAAAAWWEKVKSTWKRGGRW
jgi:HEAT repeat protein